LTGKGDLGEVARMLLLAHRGASADAPENTLSAFREAVAQGADGVELDAMVCGSGEVVVCHDETLDRLAGVDFQVRRTSYARLRRLDVGSRLGFTVERIPLLEEVLEALPSHLLINVELKCDAMDDLGLSVKVAELIQQRGMSERIIISSFNPWCLIRMATAAPALRRGFLIDPDKPFFPQRAILTPLTATHSVHPFWKQVTVERAEAWQRAGLKLAVWTVDAANEARRLASLGVSYCITNRPGALREELAQVD